MPKYDLNSISGEFYVHINIIFALIKPIDCKLKELCTVTETRDVIREECKNIIHIVKRKEKFTWITKETLNIVIDIQEEK